MTTDITRRPAPSFIVDLDKVPQALRGGTVAIGNFDGVHRGHQAVVGRALGGHRPALALTLEPHPRTYFGPSPVFRLTPAPMKARVLQAMGLDAMVVARFDAAFAALPAEAFVDEIVVAALGAREIVVGHDFNFGAKRGGNVELLVANGPRCGFTVDVVDPQRDEQGAVVSSSRIRRLLSTGDVEGAAALLGYRYTVTAEVVHGEKRGRTLGYPTANQVLPADNALRHGIYAVRTHIGGRWRNGVASFGARPTFEGDGRPLLETFVFDFAGDLYGAALPVTFVRHLRAEAKFEGVEALVAQMHADSRAARAALTGLRPLSALDAALNFDG